MRIAKLEEGIENMEKGVIKLVRSLAKLNKISPKKKPPEGNPLKIVNKISPKKSPRRATP